MAKNNTKMIYDVEEDILSLSRGRKIKASIEVSDFVIDIDFNGFVAGIEIINASLNLNLHEKKLRALKKASLGVTYKPGMIILYLIMNFKEQKKEVTIPLSIDLGHGSVKKERTLFAAT